MNIAEDLNRSFDLATLRREAKGLRTPRHWQQASELMRRCQSVRVREKDLYATRYDARVETARRRLVNEAGAVRRELKPAWAAEDRFAPDTTLRQAERDVRLRHHARIERVDEFERRSLRELVTTSMRENNRQGQAQEAFIRATDRRDRERRRGRLRDRE
jgi:hypothetical protein